VGRQTMRMWVLQRLIFQADPLYGSRLEGKNFDLVICRVSEVEIVGRQRVVLLQTMMGELKAKARKSQI
jgi:hypothetical protein